MTRPGRRIALVTFGTRGDVLPFCVLGRALVERGHAVRVVTISDYHNTVRRFGLEPVETGEGFKETLTGPEFEALFGDFYASPIGTVRALPRAVRRLSERIDGLLRITLGEVRQADLVVYNPFAYFAGTFAVETGRPALRVQCQPLLPSRRQALSLLGGRAFGGLGNRLSYEPFRAFSFLFRRAFARMRREGVARRLGAFANPLTASLRDVHHVAAFSPALSPDPGDWPVPVSATGAWHAAPEPGAALPEHIEAFLTAGPAPIYVGFGSMHWGAKRNTELVLKALDIWGGRAIVSEGPGGLRLPWWGDLPKTIQATTHVDHALLFPRVAAVVHHGGAGTTQAALRAGRPNVVLPLLGDQLYWGRRVAALGAGQAPVPLGRITAEELAARIARAASDPAMAAAAADIARKLAKEPGVAAAADLVERLLSTEGTGPRAS